MMLNPVPYSRQDARSPRPDGRKTGKCQLTRGCAGWFQCAACRPTCGHAYRWRDGMNATDTARLAALVADNEEQIVSEWLERQQKAGASRTGRVSISEVATQCRDFLRLLREALAKGGDDVAAPAFEALR